MCIFIFSLHDSSRNGPFSLCLHRQSGLKKRSCTKNGNMEIQEINHHSRRRYYDRTYYVLEYLLIIQKLKQVPCVFPHVYKNIWRFQKLVKKLEVKAKVEQKDCTTIWRVNMILFIQFFKILFDIRPWLTTNKIPQDTNVSEVVYIYKKASKQSRQKYDGRKNNHMASYNFQKSL